MCFILIADVVSHRPTLRLKKNKTKFTVSKNLRNAIIKALRDIRLSKKINNTILLSPSAASFDQFINFENRGNEFKKLSKIYAKRFI